MIELLTSFRHRFGNFIGEEVESEAASEAGDQAGDYAYDDEQEEAPSVAGQELMELDGKHLTAWQGHRVTDG